MTTEERRETRRLLWANVATDALDVAVLAFCASRGGISKTGAALVEVELLHFWVWGYWQ